MTRDPLPSRPHGCTRLGLSCDRAPHCTTSPSENIETLTMADPECRPATTRNPSVRPNGRAGVCGKLACTPRDRRCAPRVSRSFPAGCCPQRGSRRAPCSRDCATSARTAARRTAPASGHRPTGPDPRVARPQSVALGARRRPRTSHRRRGGVGCAPVGFRLIPRPRSTTAAGHGGAPPRLDGGAPPGGRGRCGAGSLARPPAGGSRRQRRRLHRGPPHPARLRQPWQPCRGGGSGGRPNARLAVAPPVRVGSAAGEAAVLPRRRGRGSTATACAQRRACPPLPPLARQPTGRGCDPPSARPPTARAAIWRHFSPHVAQAATRPAPFPPRNVPPAVDAGYQRTTRGKGATSEDARASRCARRSHTNASAAAGGVFGHRRRSRTSGSTRRRAPVR